ncbi:MAG: hypothetical protein KGI97_02630 [Alphaproteobacteria bacterium]|nr:hypothetical protein [Alphaproteobacteria bacterium]
MADIQSATASILPSAASANASPNLSALTVAVQSLSQTLQDLTHAIQTNAIPNAMPQNGTLTLTTALGDITVTLPKLAQDVQQNLLKQLMALVQAGRPLVLSLQPTPQGSPQQTQAVLLISTTANPAQSQAAQTPQPTVPPPLTADMTLPAVVLPPLPENSLPQTVQAQTATIVAEINAPPPETQIQPPVPQDQPAPLPTAFAAQNVPPVPETLPLAAENLPVSSASVATPPPASIATSPPLLPPPGNDVALHIAAVLPPPAAAAPPPELAPNQILATVTGNAPDGKLILQTKEATLLLKAPAAAPIGSQVILTAEAAAPPPLLTLPQADALNLPSLPQTIAALAQIAPQLLPQLFDAHILQPNESLPGTLLLLFGAFKKGDPSGAIGNAAVASLIKAGKNDLVASLSHDLGHAAQGAQDTVVGQWQSYPIPLYAQQQFQALTLYVRNEKEGGHGEGRGGDGAPKTRFVIDMRLSKLGPMQLDGFVRPKKLDMVLRSETALPEGLHHNLREGYIKALGATGLTGSLNFQVGRRHWLTMRREARGITT